MTVLRYMTDYITAPTVMTAVVTALRRQFEGQTSNMERPIHLESGDYLAQPG